MCDQTEIDYLDGEVVWVKLGSCWWPGEVVGQDKLPPDVLPSFRKPPIAVVKFFQEDTFEYVKNINLIYKYNCSRKTEFINKGLYMYRTKHGLMEKFPEDVIRAETAVGGDIQILTRDEFQEVKKESYAGLFGEPSKKTPVFGKKGKGRGRPADTSKLSTPIRKTYKEKSDYKVHILLQQPKDTLNQSTESTSTPSTSRAGSESAEEKPQKVNETAPVIATPTVSTPTVSTPAVATTPQQQGGIYSCHSCSFSTTRLNVLILHNKTHSVTYTAYTPSPVRKKPAAKASTKTTPKVVKSPKTPRPRKEKTEKIPKKSQAKKRASDVKPENADVKKPKTDQEIKSSLLADWDDVDEDSNDESSAMVVTGSPEVPLGAESPAVPTPAELPIPAEVPFTEKKSDELSSADKPESSSDSKYEFCEDEDWHVEADAGRKIPRVKNPSKRKEETKSLSIDEDDVAKEVAELLNKTAVPELPSVPESLKIEENFPEPSIVKSPDKKHEDTPESSKSSECTTAEKKPIKAIFKTKTFFRSRHSRSQDAIGKYVAEQLNAAERMDMSECEINGSEVVSSPEARESPPVEQIKVARLAPKIQLKKMKAEAAQLREKVKSGTDQFGEDEIALKAKTETQLDNAFEESTDVKENEGKEKPMLSKCLQDVLYPTQEIKPINKDIPDKLLHKEGREDFLSGGYFSKADKVDYGLKDHFNVIPETNRPEDINVKLLENPKNKNSTNLNETSPRKPFVYSRKRSVPVEQNVDENAPKSSLADLAESNISDEIEAIIDMPSSSEETQEITIQNVHDSPESYEETRESKTSHDMQESKSVDDSSAIMINSLLSVDVNDEIIESNVVKVDQPIVEIPSSIEVTNKIIKESSTEKNQEETNTLETHDTQAPAYDVECDKSPAKDSAKVSQAQIQDISKDIELKETDISQETSPIANEPSLKKSFEQIIQPYMNESTASAVDALLSVSRETDRVPRMIGNDPPEDLFEDDNKDVSMTDVGDSEDNMHKDVFQQHITHNVEVPSSLNGVLSREVLADDNSNVSSKDRFIPAPKEHDIALDNILQESLNDNKPSESDLQIAEALINLPATAIQTKSSTELQDNLTISLSFDNEFKEEIVLPPSSVPTINVIEKETKIYEKKGNKISKPIISSESLLLSNNKSLNIRYETELEKNENLNAAQSLVQMSESIDHKINIVESNTLNNKDLPNTGAFIKKQKNGIDGNGSVEQKVALLSSENSSDTVRGKSPRFETTSSKLLKILEEPCAVKTAITKASPIKQVIVPGKEKILNFDVANSSLKSKTPAPKQKIIIRRAASNKSFISNLNEVVASPDKIILSRSKPSQDGSSVQTFTIQGPSESHTHSDPKQIIIQPKIRKITKPPTKLQKIKPHNSLVAQLTDSKNLNETTVSEESMFDINSMPVVLSDDILTPESIEKMPIVMSDSIITNPSHPPKLVKTTKSAIIENEKIPISSVPSKPELKTLIVNATTDVAKVTTPNILSKSSKLRGAKPMLVIDKATGKQKIIMTKAEPTIKEIKPAQTLLQPVQQGAGKTEKFIILPTATSPRPGRTQKIVIDPQTGKAHVLVTKGQETTLNVPETKPVSAKLIPSSSDASTPGNTVMIITNAQGAQSRIVLTPEHEKILFPNKQQPNVSQLKTITHRISTNTGLVQKTVVTTSAPVKTQTRIVPKQKSAIITSKGQLIVGGRITTSAQNIAPMPEIRPAPKRIVASEPKKLVQAIQKNSTEPLIFLQQKSGSVMQLTAAQFEHLQRTGQIVQKNPPPLPENKIVLQKSISISPKEKILPITSTIQKQRIRKTVTESFLPAKKAKSEIAIAPAPTPSAPVPPLTSLSNTFSTATVQMSPIVPTVSNTISIATTPSYSNLENFEELLPSTAIARQAEQPAVMVQPEPEVPQPELVAPPTQISDGQLLALPGENFGGPANTFYLCVEDNGTFTPIDNRPLVLENNQLVPMIMEPMPVFTPQPERRDILEAALANSDVFHAETPRDEAPDFRDLNANVSVHCRVSETSTTLNQPIMTPVEMPTKGDSEPAAVPANLEDGLAVIGVTPHMVPTSLELPITVTDPRIAPKTTDPLSSSNYRTTLLPSPSTEMTFTTEEVDTPVVGPISMPLLTDEESVGKSMPILTDDVTERTVSSVESALGSPSSIDVRESENEEGGQWSRRLLTPGSDVSVSSVEIPLQPVIHLSVNDLSHHS